MTGTTAYFGGAAAEDCAARFYERSGHDIVARRWRGSGGEIDIVARDGVSLVFIEVKKSSDFTRAAARLSRRQIMRILGAAREFLSGQPDGQNSDVRFDVALVNMHGQMDIIENAFCE